MKISRTIPNPKGAGKKLQRVYGVGLTWPMAIEKRSFRRGPYPSKFWVFGFLRFFVYDQAVKPT